MDTNITVRKAFKMDPQLLHHVIKRQAGTLEKAVLELVSNSVDAGASVVDVFILPDRLTVDDNGRGFASEGEIDKVFTTFGTPHDEGDGAIGTFRIGRGQPMSYGSTVWRSNEFEMTTDLRTRGLEHGLRSGLPPHAGCRVTVDLYDTLLPSAIARIEKTLREWLAWLDIKVVINGRQASKRPETAKWTVETKDAWILVDASHRLLVFNRGVFVCDHGASRYGVGGVVVTKPSAKLGINMARNDIEAGCPVWRGIQAELRKHSDRGARAKSLNDNQRAHYAQRIMSGEMTMEEALRLNLRLLTVVTGQQITFAGLRRSSTILTKAPAHDVLGLAVHQNGHAMVLADATTERFGTPDLATLRTEWLRIVRREVDEATTSNRPHWDLSGLLRHLETCKIVDLNEFDHLMEGSHRDIGDTELDAADKALLKALNAGSACLAKSIEAPPRIIRFGDSSVAESWTNGYTVWLNRQTLPQLRDGLPSLIRIASILLSKYHVVGSDIDGYAPAIDYFQAQVDIATRSGALGLCALSIIEALMSAGDKGKRWGTLISLMKVRDYESAIDFAKRTGDGGPDDATEA